MARRNIGSMESPHARSTSQAGESSRDESTPQKTRACANCARVKMKCRWPTTGVTSSNGACTRCSRMELQCHVPEPTQRRRRGKSTRVAQLEQKIDGIVSLLAASQHINAKGPSPLTPESVDAIQPSCQSSKDTPTCRADCGESIDAPRTYSSFQLVPGFQLTVAEAAKYLDAYREDYMPNYPFVIIPAHVDVHMLYTESPGIFWTVISAVAAQSITIQLEVKVWFRRYIAEHVVVGQEKDLKHLQAILLHLAWGDFFFYINMEATNLLQIAIALSMDLRLDRSPESLGANQKGLLGDAWTWIHKLNMSRTTVIHTLDEKRASLGLYHLASFVTSMFRRGAQFRWRDHMALFCDSLLDSNQYASDALLVAMVKMQRIMDRMYNVLPGSDVGEVGPTVYEPLMDVTLSGIGRELDQLADQQPESVRQHYVFRAFYSANTMRIYDPAVSMRPPLLPSPEDPFSRPAALWKCLGAGSSFFHGFNSIPLTSVSSLPLTVTGLLGFSIVTISRLLFHDSCNDWQPAAAQANFDFMGIMQRTCDLFEAADEWAEETGRRRRLLADGNGTVLCKYSVRLRWIMRWYRSRVSPDETWPGQVPPSAAEAAQDVEMAGWPEWQLDDMFWQELLSTSDSISMGMPTGFMGTMPMAGP